MLTPNQYESIGRLALAFNEVEVIIEAYFKSILSTPEPSVALLIAEEDTISRKIERFTSVVRAITGEGRPAIFIERYDLAVEDRLVRHWSTKVPCGFETEVVAPRHRFEPRFTVRCVSWVGWVGYEMYSESWPGPQNLLT